MGQTAILALILFSVLTCTSCGIQTSEDTGTISDNESIEVNNTNTMANDNGTKISFDLVNEEMKLMPEKGDTIATLKTSKGDIKALIYTNEAPITTENFIKLAEQGKYKNVPFHRVINDFMIQTGDFESKNGFGGYSFNGPGTKIEDEFGKGLKHLKGALSMANSGPNTGGSQFFIVQRQDGTDWLDGKHAIFGFVYEGLEIVDQIAGVETIPGDRPVEEVLLLDVEISTY